MPSLVKPQSRYVAASPSPRSSSAATASPIPAPNGVIVSTCSASSGDAIATVSAEGNGPILVPLEKYWGIWKGAVRGGFVGAVRMTDDYGRKTVRVFHRGLYPASGSSVPVYDYYSRTGEL